MPLVYSSNSPYLLDYLASVKSREEIKEDPNLCQLLENPYIKDNMEIALAYREAERGDYNKKQEFVECLLANGPELEADTILHYRNIILNDSIYTQIASRVTTNMARIDEIRVQRYGKQKDEDNCFKEPCNYLGPLSGDLLLPLDYRNYGNIANFWSMYFNHLLGNKDKGNNSVKIDNGKPASNEIDASQEGENAVLRYFKGPLYVDILNKMIPNVRDGYDLMCQTTKNQLKQLGEELKPIMPWLSKKHSGSSGDANAIVRAEKFSANAKTNLYAKLGDCYRLVEHMRKFNPYDLSQNKKGTLPNIAQKNVIGNPNGNQYVQSGELSITTDSEIKKQEALRAEAESSAENNSTTPTEPSTKEENSSNNSTPTTTSTSTSTTSNKRVASIFDTSSASNPIGLTGHVTH